MNSPTPVPAPVLDTKTRLVVCARTCAEIYRLRATVICRDPQEAEQCRRLQADAERCDAMADRWEKNLL